jgi:hypothetical protein
VIGLAGAHAATRTYQGELGCDRLEDQVERLDLMSKAVAAAGVRARGQETPASKAEADRVAQRMADLSESACTQLQGQFRVLKRQAFQGGHIVLVEHDAGMRQLWVLEP